MAVYKKGMINQNQESLSQSRLGGIKELDYEDSNDNVSQNK